METMLLARLDENDVASDERTILFRLIFGDHLYPRGAADDIVDLVLIMGALEVFLSRLQHIDAATHRRNAQKFGVWNGPFDASF